MPESVIGPTSAQLRMVLEGPHCEVRRITGAIVRRGVGHVHDVGVLEPHGLVAHPLRRTLRPISRRRIRHRHLLVDACRTVLGQLHGDEDIALLEDIDLALVAVLRVDR